MFDGFQALSANFTPTPNQFFDIILAEEDCVVKIVGYLIRATLGWEEPRTKSRRIEAALPMTEFVKLGMARNSVRKGLDLALERGYIIKTAEETTRLPARYALRWEDMEGQTEALRRERMGNGERGSKNDPVKICTSRGSKNDPPYNRNLKKEEIKKKTLNVEEAINCVDVSDLPDKLRDSCKKPAAKNLRVAMLDKLTAALVNELGDLGSEKRHCQLLDICERNGLDELAKKALLATRRRLAQEQEQGVLEKPGAYYQKILIGLLEEHQVFVPPAGSKDEQAEVRRLTRQSLALAGVSPSEKV